MQTHAIRDVGSTTSSSDAAWLGTLIRGNGTALKTPTAAQLPTLMQQICAQMPHRLVW